MGVGVQYEDQYGGSVGEYKVGQRRVRSLGTGISWGVTVGVAKYRG